MNPLIIVLGIVIFVILYYIIQYYFFTTKSLAAKIYLKESPADISSNVIINPSSILYSFGTWVYVNNFSNCRLFTYSTTATTTATTTTDNTLFTLVLGKDGTIGENNKPKLTAFINGKKSSNVNINKQVIISNNFPIQKWVHVLVSVDTTFVDCYLDGKLVVSNPLTPNEQITTAPTAVPSITFKNSTNPSPDIYLAKLTRWDYALDPQMVWTEYSSGNGISSNEFAIGMTIKSEDNIKNYNIYSN